MSRLRDNENYIANPRGRKWVWGNVKVIGQFSAIDFIIISIVLVVTIPFWFIKGVDLVSLFLVSIVLYLATFIMIIEVHGRKNYETIWELVKFAFQKEGKVSTFELVVTISEVYEVFRGFDVTNLTKQDEQVIEDELKSLFSSLRSGSIKIKKFNATLRLKEFSEELQAKLRLEANENKGQVMMSYLANVDGFKKQAMPNLFIEFHNVNQDELRGLIKRFKNVLQLQKMDLKEYNALHQFVFGDDELKIGKSSIKTGTEEMSACRIEWGRNVPSFYLQDLIFNDRVAFALEIKNPSFEEQEKIKKDVKRWSKQVIREQEVKGKNVIDQKEEIEALDAKDNVLGGYLFGNDDLKLFNGWVLVKKDLESSLSMKKQIGDLNLILRKSNLQLNPSINQQVEFLESFVYASETRRWFPTNTSTIAFGCPWQNQSLLDSDGAYIGTSDEIYPFVLDGWKDGAASKHTGIVARTGAGKSVLMQVLLAGDEVMHQVRNIVLDPKDSGFGETILNQFGGVQKDVFKARINPLAFSNRLNEENFSLMIDEKMAQIEEFLFILFKREVEKDGDKASLLSKFANQIKKFFLIKKADLMNGVEFSFGDIQRIINTKEFDFFFEKLIEGTFSRFNCKDDFGLKEKRSMVFNLKRVIDSHNEAVKNAILFLVLAKVNDEIYQRDDKDTKLGIWIDEAGDFFKSEYLVALIEKMIVKSRAFKTKIVWATQNITDLIGSDQSKLASILANSEHLFTGQLKDNQLAELNKMLLMAESESFSEVEKNWIRESINVDDKGKFIYQSGGFKRLIQVDYLNNFILKEWIERELERKGRE